MDKKFRKVPIVPVGSEICFSHISFLIAISIEEDSIEHFPILSESISFFSSITYDRLITRRYDTYRETIGNRHNSNMRNRRNPTMRNRRNPTMRNRRKPR